MPMKKLKFLFFLICGITLSQNLEEDIYAAAETFMANKNDVTLKHLTERESKFKAQVKSKDEQLALVFLLSHKGYYLDQKSRLNEAISTFEDALNRFNSNELSKRSDFDIIEHCLKPLGNLYTKTNDYTNAENIIKAYIFLAEKSNHVKHQTSGVINLAILYQTIGKHETALKLTSTYIDKQNLDKHQKEKIIQLHTQSQITLKKINKISDIPEASQNSSYYSHRSHYMILLQNNKFEAALKAFNQAKKQRIISHLSVRELAKLYLEEAQLYKLLNQPDRAKTNLNSAIKTLLPETKSIDHINKVQLYAENTFIDIFDLYATWHEDYKLALKYYDFSFYVSRLLENNWTSQENKISNQAANRIRSELCIDMMFNEFLSTKKDSLLITALQYAEFNKSGVLKEKAIKKALLRKHPNDSLLIKETHLLKQQESITGRLINEQLGNTQAAIITDLSSKLNRVSIALKTLNERIRKVYPELKSSNFSLQNTQARLNADNAVLIEYFYGKKNLYQFVINDHEIKLNRIPLEDGTQKRITDFIHLFDTASIINNNVNKFTNLAFSLYKTLNLKNAVETKNMIVIPDGLLNFVPFEALLTSKTNTTNFSKMPFVVQKYQVLYNTSIPFYLKQEDHIMASKLLGVFPIFENTNNSLTYSIDEAHAIEGEMASRFLLKEQATKKAFIEHSAYYDILHLSTHASSGDFSTPANIEFYNNTLFLNELYSLDLNTNLVVLSACETGVGKLHKGEGAMSIARGFQYAGAQNILFSLWQINDLSTSQVMASFYKNYSDNKSANLANHQSKIDYLQSNSISNIKKSPYYWSAFVYYGQFMKPESDYNKLINTFVILIALLIILFLRYRIKISYGKDTSGVSS